VSFNILSILKLNQLVSSNSIVMISYITFV